MLEQIQARDLIRRYKGLLRLYAILVASTIIGIANSSDPVHELFKPYFRHCWNRTVLFFRGESYEGEKVRSGKQGDKLGS